MGVPCPAFDEEQKKLAEYPELTAVLESDPELLNALAENGQRKTLGGVVNLYSIVRIEVRIHRM